MPKKRDHKGEPSKKKVAAINARDKKATEKELKPLFDAAVALQEQGEAARGQQRLALLNQAIQKYNEVLALKPNDLDTHYNIGGALAKAAESEGLPVTEVDRLLGESVQSFARVMELDTSGRAEVRGLASCSLANTIATRAQKESDLPQKVALYQEACTAFETAAKSSWEEELHLQWGETLIEMLILSASVPSGGTDKDLTSLFQTAEAALTKAFEGPVGSFDAQVLSALARLHLEYSRAMADLEAPGHPMLSLLQAGLKHAEGSSHLRDASSAELFDVELATIKGGLYTSLGETMPPGDEAVQMLGTALEQYERATQLAAGIGEPVVEIRASEIESALSLIRLVPSAGGEIAARVQHVMVAAVQVAQNDILVQYNAACICALLQLESDCKSRLEESVRLSIAAPATETNRIGPDDVISDTDLKNASTTNWFAACVQALRWNSVDYLIK